MIIGKLLCEKKGVRNLFGTLAVKAPDTLFTFFLTLVCRRFGVQNPGLTAYPEESPIARSSTAAVCSS
jgi:hypothetical protein